MVSCATPMSIVVVLAGLTLKFILSLERQGVQRSTLVAAIV